VLPVARQQLPTPAALNELAEASPDPTDGIYTRFVCCMNHSREASHGDHFTDTASNCMQLQLRIVRIALLLV
jgi:hypothetical protein